jgi:hypothetical protein
LSLTLAALSFLVSRERVVFLEVAEGRLRAAERVRRHRRAVAARVDARFPGRRR